MSIASAVTKLEREFQMQNVSNAIKELIPPLKRKNLSMVNRRRVALNAIQTIRVDNTTRPLSTKKTSIIKKQAIPWPVNTKRLNVSNAIPLKERKKI